MPPHQNKTNFRTYESSVRLLAAVLASSKPKLNYTDLAALMGGGTTEFAVQHRLRPVKQLGKMQLACKAMGKDPGELPVENQEIHKLFGESTPGGLQWQFREIKALGKAQQDALDEKKNPADIKLGAPTRASAASTPATSKKTRTASGATSSKRKRSGKNATMSEEDSGENGTESNYEAKDVHSDDDSPAPKRRNTGTRASATKASAAKANGTTASKKNGNTKVTNSTDGVARNLFGSSNGSKSTNGSVFGNGINSIPTKSNNEIQIIDSDDDKTTRKTSTRSSRVKEEAEPDEDYHASHQNASDLVSSPSMFTTNDDLSDGEI
ncbi:hypothetical protein F4781DRAFT_430570 [Annulohypoxylon bovei var. microspora]|nr:hypothetical protein F4781DRAFT_430570 [Annulohypoxylon bovei var. microspora]